MSCIAICGDSASGKSVLTNLLAYKLGNSSIVECDRYHKWERDSVEWTHYTHLNPEANYIDLMNKDILALKNGQSVYRSDYDHTNGTFTEPNEIKSAQNIIVCGLHTFMCPKNLYDLKVFMNTDSVLKTEWKIARDMTKRGYKIEQVQDQIKRRKKDFELFIKPLMQDADIIVNFRTKNDLRIMINRKYSLDNILKNIDVSYTLEEYKDKSQLDIKTGTNYNYIVLCIVEALKQND